MATARLSASATPEQRFMASDCSLRDICSLKYVTGSRDASDRARSPPARLAAQLSLSSGPWRRPDNAIRTRLSIQASKRAQCRVLMPAARAVSCRRPGRSARSRPPSTAEQGRPLATPCSPPCPRTSPGQGRTCAPSYRASDPCARRKDTAVGVAALRRWSSAGAVNAAHTPPWVELRGCRHPHSHHIPARSTRLGLVTPAPTTSGAMR